MFQSDKNSKSKVFYQSGAALILMMFVIGLGTAAYLLTSLNASNAQAERDKKTMASLAAAKQALIAWAVNHPNHPGIMPFPDRNDDAPQRYDDKSDCVNVGVDGSHLIGRLPLLSDINCVPPQDGLGVDVRDGYGEKLWYSVSVNVVRMNDAGLLPVINPSIVNNPQSPWFKVLDRNGNVISDRVAAVIMSAGPPSDNQDRSGGNANPNQYLDKIVMADGTPYKNYGYQAVGINPIQEFIIGDDFRSVAKNDPAYFNQTVEPYYYNDKLIYITIDELMYALEKRVAAEVKETIKNYKSSTGYYPYASIMGVGKNRSCVNGKLYGALPLDAPHSAVCWYTGFSLTSSSSTCSFSEVESVAFTKAGLSFTSKTGACQFSGKVCTCFGAGSCTRATQQFSCDAAGECTANIAGGYQFIGGAFDSVTGRCSSSCGGDIACSGTGAGAFSHASCADDLFNDAATNSKLPAWFTDNAWQNYVYYAVQRGASPALTVGGKNGVTALTITTGYPIGGVPFSSKGSAQLQPSCSVNDYLDSVENTNADNVYDAISKPKANNYNDQIFIVSP